MSANEYASRAPRNIIGIGNHRASGDEFNSHLKRERRPDPPEYASSGVEERRQYAERRDSTS